MLRVSSETVKTLAVCLEEIRCKLHSGTNLTTEIAESAEFILVRSV